MWREMHPLVRGAVLLLALITATGLLLGLLWGVMDMLLTSQFEGRLSRIRAGMSKAEVVHLLGAPGAVASSERQLEAEPKPDWLTSHARPVKATGEVLLFFAPERAAYIYLDARGRVEAAVVGARGEGYRLVISPSAGPGGNGDGGRAHALQ
jgi:hypothetical protein